MNQKEGGFEVLCFIYVRLPVALSDCNLSNSLLKNLNYIFVSKSR